MRFYKHLNRNKVVHLTRRGVTCAFTRGGGSTRSGTLYECKEIEEGKGGNSYYTYTVNLHDLEGGGSKLKYSSRGVPIPEGTP